MEPIIINKEQIKDLSFKSPLSFSQDENIHKKLEAATRLGNGYQTKITIVFQDDEGLKRVIPPFGRQDKNTFVSKAVCGFQSITLYRLRCKHFPI